MKALEVILILSEILMNMALALSTSAAMALAGWIAYHELIL